MKMHIERSSQEDQFFHTIKKNFQTIPHSVGILYCRICGVRHCK